MNGSKSHQMPSAQELLLCDRLTLTTIEAAASSSSHKRQLEDKHKVQPSSRCRKVQKVANMKQQHQQVAASEVASICSHSASSRSRSQSSSTRRPQLLVPSQNKRSGRQNGRLMICNLLGAGAMLSLIVAATMGGFAPAASDSGDFSARVSQAAGLLQGIKGAGRLAQKLDLAKSGGQLGDWVVQQVAPAVATKLIDNVLQAPGNKKKGRSNKSSSADSPIDTQALADKIVDKVADSIKKKRKAAEESKQAAAASSSLESPAPAKGHNRRGKSLMSDSVHQVVQNLFAKDNRKLFGRAMEKSKLPFRFSAMHGNNNQQQQQQQHQHHNLQLQQQQNNNYNNNSNSWMRVTEPVYDQHLFVSTDSSQLDDNPVVLRAEHGHNLTTVSPPPPSTSAASGADSYNNQNLSPLISSLMSSSATNQMGQKLLQKHRLQQKYVHTNRHQQQHLSPKPYPSSMSNGGRRQMPHTQSPYSLSVTSDMNIVQAPSSPAPPPPQTLLPTTPSTTTTTTTSTTTPSSLLEPFSFVPHLTTTQQQHHHHQQQQQQLQQQLAGTPATVTQLGPNKFKFNNRHQQPPNSVALAGAPSSWYSSNRQQQFQASGNHHQRFPNQHHHHQPAPTTTSTTSTTTSTTTTSTTTPEPQTEPTMAETMDPIMDLDQQSSGSSILGAALESLATAATGSNDINDYNAPYLNTSYSGHQTSLSSSSSSSHSTTTPSGSIKAASPSTTTARHSVISAEAIPTALGAPLYHLTRANFTATSIMGPPPRRSGQSPAAKMAVQYFQKGLNSISTNIFSRQSKNLARRLGIGSLLFTGLLYGAAILSNPGAPLPTTGLEVLQLLTKNKRRRGSSASLLPPVGDATKQQQQFAIPALPQTGNINPALLDNAVLNILYQQPQLIPIFEQMLQQEQQLQQQQQQQQSSLFSQRSFGSSPVEIESFDQDPVSRRTSPSQIYTIQALPAAGPNMASYANAIPAQTLRRRR